MSTVLVTGAAGFIGSHTCDLLLSSGHSVIGVDNFRTGCRSNLDLAFAQPYFKFIEGDCCALGTLDQIAAQTRPDALIHLAALVSVQESVQDPILNFELNLRCTHLVAEIARVHRIPRLVFASSAAVYGDAQTVPLTEQMETRPISPYGAAKLASEAILLGHAAAYGFTVRCQRYFNVYGPRQDPKSPYSGVTSIFCHKMRSCVAPLIFGDGEQTRDFIYVHDVARANVLAATAPGISSGIANICSGRSTSINQLATGLRVHFAETPVPIYTSPKVADIRHSLGSPNEAASAIGFSAEVSLAEGLSKLALQA